MAEIRTVSTLIKKRAEIRASIRMHDAKTAQARSDLADVIAVLRGSLSDHAVRHPAWPVESPQDHPWAWVYCERCHHRAPMVFVPLMIRWGKDASSDMLRRCAKCSACGHKGANLSHPGWVDKNTGFAPFPNR
ncbi:MAG: hypothetical protein WAU57_20310 [Xanthobacteraceae bacterium]